MLNMCAPYIYDLYSWYILIIQLFGEIYSTYKKYMLYIFLYVYTHQYIFCIYFTYVNFHVGFLRFARKSCLIKHKLSMWKNLRANRRKVDKVLYLLLQSLWFINGLPSFDVVEPEQLSPLYEVYRAKTRLRWKINQCYTKKTIFCIKISDFSHYSRRPTINTIP